LAKAEPRPYRRTKEPLPPKLRHLKAQIDEILAADEQAQWKQQDWATQIFAERLTKVIGAPTTRRDGTSFQRVEPHALRSGLRAPQRADYVADARRCQSPAKFSRAMVGEGLPGYPGVKTSILSDTVFFRWV
jgi:hypothetical protein